MHTLIQAMLSVIVHHLLKHEEYNLYNPISCISVRTSQVVCQLKNKTNKADKCEKQRYGSNSLEDTRKYVFSKWVNQKLKYKSCKDTICCRTIKNSKSENVNN